MGAVSSKASPPTKRIRRTAEEARREILDAAEQRLTEVGPDGLRLQDLAKDLGLSHPAILHHFGSRDALLEAVIERATEKLHGELLEALQKAEADEASTMDVLEHLTNGLERSGQGRLIAWMLLSGRENRFPPERLQVAARLLHARRTEARDDCSAAPAFEDTLFTAALVMLASFGAAVFGERVWEGLGDGDTEQNRQRFQRWFARLLLEHLEPGAG